MANPRTVINPFTKNEHRMRRNTKSTKWITAGPSTTAARNIDVENQTSKRIFREIISPSSVEDTSVRRHEPLSIINDFKTTPLESTAVRTNVSNRDTPTNSSWQKQDLHQSYVTGSATCSKHVHAQPQATEHSTPLFRAAKEIYQAGPKGEGQKVWEAYQQARNHRRANDEPSQNMSSEPTTRKINTACLPLPSSTSPNEALFPPLRPRTPQNQSGRKEKESGSPDLRRDSGFSSSSYDVPVAIHKHVQRIVDLNKPLPPVPPIQAPPKVRNPKDRTSRDAQQCTEKETAHTWWKHSPSKAPQTLKSKISHPGPLMILGEGIAVNVAAECGGVGGPAAAVSLPVTRTGAPLVGPAYEAGKSFKQTAMETLDGVHVGKKRKTSDISFACQGVANEQLDRYQVSEQSSSDEEDVLVPDPLFYAKNAGMDRKFS
ncbi:hypothetical protein CC77DRAFT_1088963 [Alternaria alternata]|uniref:Uncharacterized protein n=1 Tax=Alternaria alternata TaxID=5599 RepID=A0A177DNJ7_ALTAL|nr:hypothetical protein CC77DRAFT_1088963 [Alternaria alternata]OAG20957.1 hypothetical protein CC77DRAFT_1088963 [Alternaria alternata]